MQPFQNRCQDESSLSSTCPHQIRKAGGQVEMPLCPGCVVLARAKELVLHLYPPHNSSEKGMLSDSLTTSRTHKLAALSLAESSSRSSCPDGAGSCFEMWQEARAAQRCAGFSLHNPLTRNPDVLGHSFHSPGPAHHPAVALIVSETPLSTETTNIFSFFPSWDEHTRNTVKQKLAWTGVAMR